MPPLSPSLNPARLLRPLLLVSVRNAAEAETALAGGADWIDLKEPSRGALGAVEPTVARDVVAAVAGKAPISAAAGELAEWFDGRSRPLLEIEGLTQLKLGLAGWRGLPWQESWRVARGEVESAGKRLVAVIYADEANAIAPSRLEIVSVPHSPGDWLLIDTYDKSGGGLHDHISASELQTFLGSLRNGRSTVVAGRMDENSIRRLPLELIDMVAVRGAACVGDRTSAVSRERVAALCALLDRLTRY